MARRKQQDEWEEALRAALNPQHSEQMAIRDGESPPHVIHAQTPGQRSPEPVRNADIMSNEEKELLQVKTAQTEAANVPLSSFPESSRQRQLSFPASSSDIQKHRQNRRVGAGLNHSFQHGSILPIEQLSITTEPKSTFYSVKRSIRRKARWEKFRAMLLHMAAIMLTLLISLAFLSTISIFRTEVDALRRLASRHDIVLSEGEILLEALKHSTPWDASERKDEYNVFFDLNRYQYLFD